MKYTLIPEEFFSEETARETLSNVVILEKDDLVRSLELPCCKAVLLYAAEESDALLLSQMISAAHKLNRFNKVVVHLGDSRVDIVVATGEKLLLCNSFPASDGVTAQYFIFLAIRQFQINPELTTVYFFGEADESVKSDLFRHFASVEVI